MNRNERAYELLRWQAIAPLAPYDETIDYFTPWKAASDKALDRFDKARDAKRVIQARATRRDSDCGGKGERLAPSDAQQSRRARNRSRRQRRRA